LFKRSLAIGEKANLPFFVTALNNLGDLYRAQARYSDAEPLYKRALAIQEKALGPDNPNVALSLNNLALLYSSQGRHDDAEPLFKRSLAIGEKAGLPFVAVMNNLGDLYRGQARYSDAEPLYKRALAIQEKALGPDNPNVALSLNNLALLYSSQGRHDDAEPLFKRSLAILEKALGLDHHFVATALNNLAELYRTQGHYKLVAVAEMAIGCRRAHTRPACCLRKGEARGSFLCNERKRRPDQRLLEVAMVIAAGSGRPALLAPAHVTSLYMTRNGRPIEDRRRRTDDGGQAAQERKVGVLFCCPSSVVHRLSGTFVACPTLRKINAVLDQEFHLVEVVLHCGRKK
jgi:hypothetical protein